MQQRRFSSIFIPGLYLLLCCGPSFSTQANPGASTESLSALRLNAQKRIAATNDSDWSKQQSTLLSRWLVGAPTLEVSALQSNQAAGTDELEISLGIKLQRPDNVTLADDMALVSEAILRAQQRQQDLFVSGLVRQRVWDVVMAQQLLTTLEDKLKWLEQLGGQLSVHFEAGELSRLAYLQWQQQKLDVQQSLLDAQATFELARQAFTELTGTGELPQNVVESLPDNIDAALNSHPELKLLSLQRQYAGSAYEYGKQSQSNWDVALVVRRLQSELGNENQAGLSVGIPLALEVPDNLQDLQAWQQTDLAYSQNLINLRINLQQQLKTLDARLKTTVAQIDIAQQQVVISQQIMEQLSQLKHTSELGQSNWLLALMEQHDRTYQLEKMHLLKQQIVAQINQLAGHVL